MDTHDFRDGAGPVPAARHTNPMGDLGGWVAATAYVAPWTGLDPDAEVFGTARVTAGAMVYGRIGGASVIDGAQTLVVDFPVL